MKAIFENIAANAEQQVEAAVAALPDGFPDQLVMSTINHRVRLVADSLSQASHV
ncbi:hypothetical protein [Phyllobacterium sp. SB3]|uniref:hypothetical protein n=1 Tax=Phyllobacterium sp. SB3 TaxID=3156073 RepID=UPI0032AFDDB0